MLISRVFDSFAQFSDLMVICVSHEIVQTNRNVAYLMMGYSLGAARASFVLNYFPQSTLEAPFPFIITLQT